MRCSPVLTDNPTKPLSASLTNNKRRACHWSCYRRHIRKALELGVTKEQIIAVLQAVSVLGIHTMSLGAPILVEELAARKAQQGKT